MVLDTSRCYSLFYWAVWVCKYAVWDTLMGLESWRNPRNSQALEIDPASAAGAPHSRAGQFILGRAFG